MRAMRGSHGARMVATVQNATPKATPVDAGKPVEATGEDSLGSGVWARVFAVLYDPFLWVGERAGVRAQREQLFSRARGRTVEIGSGTGLNLAHYPDDLDELVLVEPDGAMRVRLQKRLGRSCRRARVVDAPAERLPWSDELRPPRPTSPLGGDGQTRDQHQSSAVHSLAGEPATG